MSDASQGATATLNSPGRSDAPKAVSVRLLSGPDAGKTFPLRGGTVVIGTREDCEIVLTDSNASRRHASLELLGHTVRISDLKSKNGTFCLGARIDSLEVPVGCQFRVGQTEALLEPDIPLSELSPKHELCGLVGRTVSMRRLFRMIELAGPSEAPVLIAGETGTGKEGVARAIHQLSPRAKRPFQVVHCGAVEPQLFNSSLFGHVRGAFTGAVADRVGALELADGGTLFLDEVADLPLALQPLLLRALETKTFQRLGDVSRRTSDFRLIASTQKDLIEEVTRGRFRQDLYFRLASIGLQLVPLRERLEDIGLIAERLARDLGAKAPLSGTTLAVLTSRSWPGNVRELRNTIERMVTLGEDTALRELGVPNVEAEGFFEARQVARIAFEKGYLSSLLEKHGTVSAAARAAKVARSRFYELLEEAGLKPSPGKKKGK
jgi:DNA-binding NtrC family response regulator